MCGDQLERNVDTKSDPAGCGHALAEHNALWPSIPPLCYASLCLKSTPTQHAASPLDRNWHFPLSIHYRFTVNFPHTNCLDFKWYILGDYLEFCALRKLSPCKGFYLMSHLSSVLNGVFKALTQLCLANLGLRVKSVLVWEMCCGTGCDSPCV